MKSKPEKEDSISIGFPTVSNSSSESPCKVCGHKMSSHVDEGDFLRCHSILTVDNYQCECLRKKPESEKEGGHFK